MKKKIKDAIFRVWCVMFALLDFPAMVMHNAYQVWYYKHFMIKSGTRKPVGDSDDKGDE